MVQNPPQKLKNKYQPLNVTSSAKQTNKHTHVGEPLTLASQFSRVFAGRGPTGPHRVQVGPWSKSPQPLPGGGGQPTGERSLPLGLEYPPGALGSAFTQHQGSAPPSLTPKNSPQTLTATFLCNLKQPPHLACTDRTTYAVHKLNWMRFNFSSCHTHGCRLQCFIHFTASKLEKGRKSPSAPQLSVRTCLPLKPPSIVSY